MNKLLNSIIILWSIHPYFRGLTFIMIGSWLILMFFTGSNSSTNKQALSNQKNNSTVTNSTYNYGAPIPSIPAGSYIGNNLQTPTSNQVIQVKPSESMDNAVFKKLEKDNFATVKEKK